MTTHPPGHPSGPTGPGRLLIRLLPGRRKGTRPPSTSTKPPNKGR